MDIKVLASSSKGNCCRISDGSTSLLLDCGITIEKIMQGLDFEISGISGCLVTHEHFDHSKAVKALAKLGVDIYMSAGTQNAIKQHGHRIIPVKALNEYEIGSMNVMAFNVQHDAEEPLGFLVYSNKTGDKLLYLADTFYCKYRFNGLTQILIECNYDKEILEQNIENGTVPELLRRRLLRSHFSIENVVKFLKANDLSKVQEIYLIHMSNQNADEARFKREIQELTGKQVIVC